MNDSNIELEIEVSGYSVRGFGIGYLEQPNRPPAKVEIAHAIAGDRVKIALKRKSKGVKKGKLLEVLTPSKNRVTPRCSHAHMCGGCTLQQMDYKAQLKHKEEIVRKAFKEFITDGTKVEPIIPCENPWHYRNKMEFSFSENAAGTRYLGLMIAHAASYVFNLDACHLANSWFSDVLNAVRKWWENSGLKAYHMMKNSGHLRYLTIREGVKTNEKMVILTISGHPDYPFNEEAKESFVKTVLSILPQENLSIILRIQKIQKGTPTTLHETTLFGPGSIKEKLDIFPDEPPLFFKIGPSSFFQPNTLQAEILYRTGLDMLELPPDSIAYDLYSGTGTLGMCLARRAKKVIGIELNPQAVLNAKENIALNGLTNFEMLQGDVGKVITGLMAQSDYRPPDAVIVDPPRAGLDPLALHHMKTLKPKNILYISCNPLTQAENVKELFQAGYKLKRLQPVDQFPHTSHVENIAHLVL